MGRTEFVLVEGDSAQTLTDKVNHLLIKGWILNGGGYAAPNGSNSFWNHYQPMSKYYPPLPPLVPEVPSSNSING